MKNAVMNGVDFRRDLTEAITRVNHGTAITVTNYGRPAMVAVPHEWYERAVRALFNAEINGDAA